MKLTYFWELGLRKNAIGIGTPRSWLYWSSQPIAWAIAAGFIKNRSIARKNTKDFVVEVS